MSRNPPCRPRSGATALAGRAPKPNVKGAVSTIPKCAPAPKRQSRFNINKPRETRTMVQRVEKSKIFREECERKERERKEQETSRRPQRAAAPTGGDARMGRERQPRPPGAQPPRSRPTSAKSTTGAPQACSTKAPHSATQRPPARSAGPPPAKRASSAPAPKAPARKSAAPPAARREPETPAPAPPVPERTRNLAESMNADIVQAEPLQPGMVDNIIIPPGAINSEKTTIVSIPQPESPPPAAMHSTIAAGSGGGGASSAANRSMQVISEALEEQEANESAVINSKLQDLQNARRDFVLAVANVGNNSINLGDEDFGNIMDITPPEMMMSSDMGSPIPSGRLLDFSDDDPCTDYGGGQHQPMVESAREYMRSRQSYQQDDADLLDPEYLEGCALAGPEEYQGQLPTCGPSDNYTVIPRRREQYQYPPYPVDELERFFDLENYPPCPRPTPPRPTGPPPGREHINPDLWELDDPWCHGPDEPDLIDWGDYC